MRANNYVVDQLIDWTNVPNDPIFQLTFPQPGMLHPEDLKMYTDGTLYYTNTNLTNVNANIQFDRIGSGYNYSYTVAPQNMAAVLIYDQIITDDEVKGAYYARQFTRDSLH